MIEDLSVNVLMLNDSVRKKRDYDLFHERNENMGSELRFCTDLLLTTGIFLLTCRERSIFRYLYNHRNTIPAIHHCPQGVKRYRKTTAFKDINIERLSGS